MDIVLSLPVKRCGGKAESDLFMFCGAPWGEVGRFYKENLFRTVCK